MLRINYKQLHQFWTVAKAGALQRAAEQLHLTPQTLSGQIAALEQSLGVLLFRRAGRRLELTDTGRLVRSYADEIFEIGSELEEALRGAAGPRATPFRVGLSEVVPKSLACQLLGPALDLPESLRLVCREDKLSRLLGELAVHRLDLVLSDRPMPVGTDVKAYSRKLGECGIAFFASAALCAQHPEPFPRCLDAAPFLAPGEDTAVRAPLLRWLDAARVQPRVIGEFDDSALMKAFGAAGRGYFIAPTAVSADIQRHYGVIEVGRTSDVIERFYAISVQRRLSHPAIRAIGETARTRVFGAG